MYISVFILKEIFRMLVEIYGIIKGLYLGNKLVIVDWLVGCCLVIIIWFYIICICILLKYFIFLFVYYEIKCF